MSLCKSDPKAPTAAETTQEMLKAFTTYLPGVLEVLNQNIAPSERAMLDAAKQISPERAALDRQIAAGNQMAQAEADSAVLKGPGGGLIDQVLAQQKKVDPEFFRSREAGAKGLEDLFKSIDLSGMLSGSEEAQVERGLNRMGAQNGNLAVPSAVNTIKQAMSFGDASFAKKSQQQGAMTNALGATAQFMPTSRTGIDPFQVTTGKPAFSQAGTQALGGNVFGMGQSLLGDMGQTQRIGMDINAQRRSAGEKILGAMPDY